MTASTPSKPFRFGDLPAEIRLRVLLHRYHMLMTYQFVLDTQ